MREPLPWGRIGCLAFVVIFIVLPIFSASISGFDDAFDVIFTLCFYGAIAAAILIPLSRRHTRDQAEKTWSAATNARERAIGAAQAAWNGGYYCHHCSRCFWQHSSITRLPIRKPLPPSEFQRLVKEAGGYATLPGVYGQVSQ
ncbi:hypothetical protein AB0N05_17395 [Nocardia sp. NPDC051030]|uniref:hypothetical protein n=1 Tax=Nocardia sp. NPDC051030 TaxID=3155162 RepID=UPI0034122782